jgi:ferredoxin
MLACIRCGLCLTSCPTYVLSLGEAEGPRGRVGMARALAEGHLDVTPDLVAHELSCLVCDACSAVCPSGCAHGSAPGAPPLELAKRNIAAFERIQGPIVVNSAGCGAMLKDYAHHLRDDRDWSERARSFSARVRDLSEVIEPESLAIERRINLYRPAMGLPSVEAMLLFEVDGNPPGVRWDAARITEVIAPLAAQTEWSDEAARINALWEARSVVGAAVGTLRPGSQRAYCGEDICVPVARIPETLRAIEDISARYRIPIATYGHIGGGGLHPGNLIDGRDPDEVQRVLRVADEIHQLALRMGGTTTGEHGVGTARAPYMAQEHGAALEVMRRIKRALDPNGIMNPGVIFDPPKLPFEFPLIPPVGESTAATIDPG